MNKMFIKKIGVLLVCSFLFSCSHAKEQNVSTVAVEGRSPQSVASPETVEEAVFYLANLISDRGQDDGLYDFNKRAVTLCWRNSAWDKISFKDAERKKQAKIFLCNIPMQFRMCHTIRFLKIEKQYASGEISLTKRNSEQEQEFKNCDENRTSYLRNTYRMRETLGGKPRSLNSYTNGKLLDLYRVILFERDKELTSSLKEHLRQVHPSEVFHIEEKSLDQKLEFADALALARDGLKYDLKKRDILDLILFFLESQIQAAPM